MGILRDCYLSIVIVISLSLLILSIFTGLKAGYYETSRFCSMSWSRPQYTEIQDLTNVQRSEIAAIYPSTYKMFHHHQETHQFVQANKDLRKPGNKHLPPTKDIDTIVVFIPGQSGSYLQIRSIASRMLHQKYLLLPQHEDANFNNHHNNILFLTFNFGEEWSSTSSKIIARQTAFVYMMLNEYLCYNLSLVSDVSGDDKNRVNIILYGHSMGGIVVQSLINILSKPPAETKSVAVIDRFNTNFLSQIAAVVFVSTPLLKPVLEFENHFQNFYKFHTKKFRQIVQDRDLKVLSMSGGLEDFLIESYLSQMPGSNNVDFVVSEWCPTIMNTMDHQATIWCHAMTETISRYLIAVLHGEKTRAQYLYPFVPQIEHRTLVHDDSNDEESRPVFDGRLDLEDTADSSLIVVSCSYRVRYLELCRQPEPGQKETCSDITSRLHTIPSWTSHANDRFNTSLDHEHHGFIPKFMAVLHSKDISFVDEQTGEQVAKYLKVRGTPNNPELDTCSLWQGRVATVNPSNDNKIARNKLGSIATWNMYRNFNLQANRVYTDDMRLSPLMYHDIKLTITPPISVEAQSENANNYICISGASGKINPALNGVYKLVTGRAKEAVRFTQDGKKERVAMLDQYYEQELSYWYSPYLQMNPRPKNKANVPQFYIYKVPNKGMWGISNDLGSQGVNAFCDEKETPIDSAVTPLDCKQWNLLEFNLNDPTRTGYRAWRQRVKLSVTDTCSPYDVSLLHLTMPNQSHLYNQWVSISSVHSQTIHRMMVPRLNNRLQTEHMENSLRFEWYLFHKSASADTDGEDEGAYVVNIEYNYLSSMINTAIRDYAYFPFAMVMSLWFGMIGEMYQVRDVDRVNFYVVSQSILMVLSCLDFVPVNDHWKYVYLSWHHQTINSANFGPYLLEFILPYIYFSSCIVILHAVHFVLRLVVKDIVFRLIESVGMNELFVIPFALYEYAVYVTIVVYGISGLLMPDLNAAIKQSLPSIAAPSEESDDGEVELKIQYVIFALLASVLVWNLLKRIVTDSNWFGFYESLLCIVLVFTRWDILFGVIETQQVFELTVIAICLFVVSYFKIGCGEDTMEKYSKNVHAKAMLSLCSQLYIMQRNMSVDVWRHKFMLTPLMQSIIVWSVCKILMKRLV